MDGDGGRDGRKRGAGGAGEYECGGGDCERWGEKGGGGVLGDVVGLYGVEYGGYVWDGGGRVVGWRVVMGRGGW